MSVPCMKVWILQWNLYAPAAGAVNVAVLPPSIVTSNPPSSAVTVCWVCVSFFTVTVDPAFTGVVWNLMSTLPLVIFTSPTSPLDTFASNPRLVRCAVPSNARAGSSSSK